MILFVFVVFPEVLDTKHGGKPGEQYLAMMVLTLEVCTMYEFSALRRRKQKKIKNPLCASRYRILNTYNVARSKKQAGILCIVPVLTN